MIDIHLATARKILASVMPGELDTIEAIAKHLDHEEDEKLKTWAWYEKNIGGLLRNIGAEQAKCRGCGQDIFWLIHKNGNKAPYTIQGLNHFADCPKSADFRKVVKKDTP